MASFETRSAMAAAASAKRSGTTAANGVRRVFSSPVESPLSTDHHDDATLSTSAAAVATTSDHRQGLALSQKTLCAANQNIGLLP